MPEHPHLHPLDSLLAQEPSELDDPELACGVAFARAGRRLRAHAETGLAYGEDADELHIDETKARALVDEAVGPERRVYAAATASDEQWPIRFSKHPWRLHIERHPESGLFAFLEGPHSALLTVKDQAVPLTPRTWTHLPWFSPQQTLPLGLTGGEKIVLDRER